jgi:histone H3/H4
MANGKGFVKMPAKKKSSAKTKNSVRSAITKKGSAHKKSNSRKNSRNGLSSALSTAPLHAFLKRNMEKKIFGEKAMAAVSTRCNSFLTLVCSAISDVKTAKAAPKTVSQRDVDMAAKVCLRTLVDRNGASVGGHLVKEYIRYAEDAQKHLIEWNAIIDKKKDKQNMTSQYAKLAILQRAATLKGIIKKTVSKGNEPVSAAAVVALREALRVYLLFIAEDECADRARVSAKSLNNRMDTPGHRQQRRPVGGPEMKVERDTKRKASSSKRKASSSGHKKTVPAQKKKPAQAETHARTRSSIR